MADRIRIGNVEIKVYMDYAPPPFEPTDFFSDIPLSAWDPYKKEHLGPDGKFRTNYCAWLLRSQGRTILVDTGHGPGGQLLNLLSKDGISLQDIDTVVITHFHGDHVGWTVTLAGDKPTATFPKARYLLPKGDWDYFTKPDVLQGEEVVRNKVVPLKELGCMELIDGDHALTSELTTLSTPGHTPGHNSILVSSQGEKALMAGDLFHGSVQVPEPDWCATFDMDKPVARKTRHALFDRLEQEGFTVCVGHLLVGNNIGKIVRLQGKRYWQAL